MGATKKLNFEYARSGWDLTGFPKRERKAWRRLLPAELAEPERERASTRSAAGRNEAEGSE